MASLSTSVIGSYCNPVYRGSFPDPFVLKFEGLYFAYCTGVEPDGRVFGILKSRNLVDWHEVGGAMQRLPSDSPHYWAPEVTYYNGRFYLYYSVGNETNMEIRVAVSERPDGDFVDSGKPLTFSQFAIDPHVFRDDDGQWYMFYATDFLDHSHIGTGTVVDRMLDPFMLEGKPRAAVRAMYDWQVYDPARSEKGGVKWYTVEGPFILKRKGKYFEMFSGGNWHNDSYGVSFALTDKIDRDGEWIQSCDGFAVAPILGSIPGKVLGPGHNSVIRGPNNRELYCVYHEWIEGERVLAIDRMDFAGERLFILGPTYSPQPAPYESPTVSKPLIVTGEWAISEGKIVAAPGVGLSETEIITNAGSFLVEMSVRSGGPMGSAAGVRIRSATGVLPLFSFLYGPSGAAIYRGTDEIAPVSLAVDFDFTCVHELRLEVDHKRIALTFDGVKIPFRYSLSDPVSKLCLVSENAGAVFSGMTLTPGFEDLFEDGLLSGKGWHFDVGDGEIVAYEGCLLAKGGEEHDTTFYKDVPTGDFELCINLRFENSLVQGDLFVISIGCRLALRICDEGWQLSTESGSFALPSECSFDEFRQLRFISLGGRVNIYMEKSLLTTVDGKNNGRVSFQVSNAWAVIDMIRYTVLWKV